MNSESNDMLTALHKFWKWEADWMTCRACERHLIASRDGEEFAHAADCKNAGLLHPWRSLRLILNDQPTQETPPARWEDKVMSTIELPCECRAPMYVDGTMIIDTASDDCPEHGPLKRAASNRGVDQ